MSPSRRTLLSTLALLALTALAYANSLTLPFVYDDFDFLLRNRWIQDLSNLPHLIGFREEGFVFLNRWPRDVTYALEYAAVGAWPVLYHVDNLLLHAGVGLLVFLLISRTFRDRRLGWWTAALFLVHPINTAVVTHISGRRGLLMVLFSLTALLLMQGYVRGRGLWRPAAALVALYLATFSKEAAVMTPFLFVVVDYYGRLHSRPGAGGSLPSSPPSPGILTGLLQQLRTNKLLYGVLGLAASAFLIQVLFFHSFKWGIHGSPSQYDIMGQPLTVLDRLRIVGLGIRLLLIPIGQSFDYSYDALQLLVPEWSWLEVLDLGVLVLAAGLTAVGLKRGSWLGFGGAWFTISYVPYMGIIPFHEIFAERFLYLSSIGPCLAVAWLLARGLEHPRPQWNRAVLVAGVALLALLTTATAARNQVWSSEAGLWQEALDRYPSSARAHVGVAKAFLAEGKPEKAMPHFVEARRIFPRDRRSHLGVADAAIALERWDQAREIVDEFLSKHPRDGEALHMKGSIHEALGERQEAFETYSRAIRGRRPSPYSFNNLAKFYAEGGDVKMAIEMYEKALERDPTIVMALRNLAIVYRLGLGDEERAAHYENRARKLLAFP